MTDARADLDAWLADDPGPSEAPDYDATPPDLDDVQAQRFLRRLARLDAEAADVRRVADAEHDRIETWAGDRLHGIDRAASWLRLALEGYARRRHEAGGGKTVHLPSGTLTLRTPGARPLVADDEAAAARALHASHPDLVRVTYALDRAAIKRATTPGPDGQAILPGGEVVAGVTYAPAGADRFDAKPAVDVEAGS